jgi:integrase/recombinase XerC
MAEHTPLHRLAEMMGHTNPDTTMIYVKGLNANLSSSVEEDGETESD